MSETLQFVAIILISIAIRWCVSLNGHSGENKPPMFGDYEAQRHWMEITVNLPVLDWYRNTTENDLNYWGLDYPPLTAYHSWICGIFAKFSNQSWVALGDSRGLESPEHKLFMRFTVLAVDLWIYLPAVITYFMLDDKMSPVKQKLCSLMMLLYPGLLLIDHGHFQYNGMSLGLTLWAVICLLTDHDFIGSVMFCLALNYKQMSLYHAMPFFCYLFGISLNIHWWKGLLKIAGLGTIVIATFCVCWYPFLQSWEAFTNVFQRLFPFNRGLFEDKVANVWCSLSVIIKLKQIFLINDLVKLCFGTTLFLLLPSSIHLLAYTSKHVFKVALVNASLIFFLFSFQVHEKSILLPALPVCLLLPQRPLHCTWFLLISGFSMLPLLIKDGLVIPLLGTSMLFLALYFILDDIDIQTMIYNNYYKNLKYLMGASLFGCVLLSVASVSISPPKKYPDLHAVLVSTYSCLHFLGFLLYFHWFQFTEHGDHNMLPRTPGGKHHSGKVTGRPMHKRKRKPKQA